MRDQIEHYAAKLLADRAALPGGVAVAVQDDLLLAEGEPRLSAIARDALSRLSAVALVAARPSLAFADLLVRRSAPGALRIEPSDTENRTFLHDIPFLRPAPSDGETAAAVARLLGERKGVVVEGLGIFAVGGITVEQAYINYSSVFHSTFVKYLQDVLREGFLLEGEEECFACFRKEWLRPLTAEGLEFCPAPLVRREEILAEMARAGRYTVERGLVDSFFGNISCRSDNTLYISQTGASLDALPGCIDPLPLSRVSTAGITASSELIAHRRVYETSSFRTILHGHPRFAVVMSMLCEEEDCGITDCWKECGKIRFLGDTPVVAGEIGAGGVAKRMPPVIGMTGAAIVYGHGVFTAGSSDFREPFEKLVAVENYCRDEYFRRLEARR